MLDVTEFVLAIVVAMLFGVIFALRVLVIMERRVARMELHIERIANNILREERIIESKLAKPKKPAVKKKSRKR